MNKLIRHYLRRACAVVFLLTLLDLPGVLGAPAGTANPHARVIDYAEPKLLVGNIFPMGPDPKKFLFKSLRTAVREGATVKVACESTTPNGSKAALDQIVYQAGRLVTFASDEFQKGEKGSEILRTDPGHPGQRTIFFEFTAAP